MNRLPRTGAGCGGDTFAAVAAKPESRIERQKGWPVILSAQERSKLVAREQARRYFSQRKAAHADTISLKAGLSPLDERSGPGGSGKRQRKSVRQDLLAIEDDMRIHVSTSCGLLCAGIRLSGRLAFERDQRLLNLVETRRPVVFGHTFVGRLVDQVLGPSPVHQD
jgi:hypothetical protein